MYWIGKKSKQLSLRLTWAFLKPEVACTWFTKIQRPWDLWISVNTKVWINELGEIYLRERLVTEVVEIVSKVLFYFFPIYMKLMWWGTSIPQKQTGIKLVVLIEGTEGTLGLGVWVFASNKSLKKKYSFLFYIHLTDIKTQLNGECILLQIFSFLEHIAEKEGIEIPQDVAQTIGNNSTYNLRQAVQLLESSALAK